MVEGVWSLVGMSASGRRCGVDEFWAWVVWIREPIMNQWAAVTIQERPWAMKNVAVGRPGSRGGVLCELTPTR